MPLVLVVGAPSGTGKTTLLARLLAGDPRLLFSVSHTTRAPRPGERDGADYRFVGRDEFERRAAAGEFLEWAEVYGNLYGTHRGEVERAAASGRDLVLDVDVQGARSVRRALPGAVLVLIAPPSWAELETRLRARGSDSEEVIARRLAQARAQLEGHAAYDYLVVNDDLDRAVAALSCIVAAERQRIGRQEAALARLLGRG